MATGGAADVIAALTGRERDVLRLLCCGVVRNRDLAEHLIVSEFTVEYHVKNVLAKLGASSRAQVVAIALTHHLVERETLIG